MSWQWHSPQGGAMDIVHFLCIGLVVGVISGMLGIGGGVLMLPALVWICELKPSRAAGTTLAVLVVPVVLPAAYEYYTKGNVDLRAALWIALAFAVGGYGGALLRHVHILPEETLRLVFGLIMIYIAFSVILSADPDAAKAAAGVVGAGAAWMAYLGLRALGRRALARPGLREQIQRMDQEGHGEADYYI
jgi:uncharacterized membrane protein YfcA